MPKIDFYLLQTTTEQGRLQFACKLAAKVYAEYHQGFVYVNNEASAIEFDTLLWTYQDIIFIPHQVLPNKGTNPLAPPQLWIGWDILDEYAHKVIINLNHAVPSKLNRHERILEIVTNNDDSKRNARMRYRAYQEAGAQLQTHTL